MFCIEDVISWTKVKKANKSWKIPTYFWISIEKGIHHYAPHPLKRDKEDMPPEPQKPVGTTFYVEIPPPALNPTGHYPP
jgi:hypothetical protein